jgi:hypothetical protein
MSSCYVPLLPIRSYSSSSIQIDFNPSKYGMERIPAVDDFVESVWLKKMEDAKKHNKILFNATKFRLDQICVNDETGQVTLNLGLTDYKNFIGVAAAAESGVLNLTELEIAAVASGKYFPRVLGVETCVVTSDNKCVLFRRSHAVAEYPDAFVFPGGHPEPSRCTTAANGEDVVRKEFFSSPVDEIVAETAIPREKILEKESLRLIGITIPRSKILRGGKPVACFVVRSSCSLHEVMSLRFGAEEKDEFDHSRVLVIESRKQAKERAGLDEDKDFTPATVAILDFLSESKDFLE